MGTWLDVIKENPEYKNSGETLAIKKQQRQEEYARTQNEAAQSRPVFRSKVLESRMPVFPNAEGVKPNYPEPNGEYRDASFIDVTLNSAKRGYHNAERGKEIFYKIGGTDTSTSHDAELASEKYKFIPSNKFEEAVAGASELVGQQISQIFNPVTAGSIATGATAGAAIAGTAGAAAGTVVPVVGNAVGGGVGAAGGAITGGIAGFKAGSATNNFMLEAGLAYDEYIKNGYDPETAKKLAYGVGAGNAALELVQLGGAGKLIKGTGKAVAGEAVEQGAKGLLKLGLDYAGGVATETGQEVLQEAVTIGGGIIGDKISGKENYTLPDVAKRLGDTAVSSALTFGVMGAPGAVMNTANSFRKAPTQTAENAQAKETHTPEQIRVMQEYENAVDDELLEFVKYAKQNPNDNKSNLKLDKVTDRLTRDIKNLVGVDVGGFSHAIKSNTITHINNEHGENGTTDRSMADEKDIARINYVLENYDTIERLPTDSKEFRDKNQRPAPTVKLSKRIDGTVYVVEAVPDTKKGQLPIISAYKTKAVPQTRTAQMPFSDARSASADTAFEDIISQPDAKSNTQNQQEGQLFDDTLNDEQRTAFTAEAQGGGKFNATAEAKTQSERKAQEVASKFGHSVVFYEGSDNGFLKGNTVYINKNTKNPVMAVAGHELTHGIMNDEALKGELIDFVKAENDVTKGFEKLFNNKKALYQSRMGEVSDDVVWEEVAADIGGDLFGNDEFISRITAEKPTLARRVLEFFRDLLARIRGNRRYSEVSGDTIDYMRDIAKVAQKYEQAFIKARENTGKSSERKFMFAGRNALTADLSALATAETMEQNGRTPEEIWKATGWGRGLDGKWRFEIDDSGAGYNTEGKGRALTTEEKQRYDELFRNFVMGEMTEAERQEYIELDNKYKKSIGVGKAGDYLNHPELYEAYPDIADIGYARVNMNDSFTNGSYDPLMNGIAVNKNLDKEGAKSTTLHEGQHIIQEKEGFGSGASPEYWQSQIDRGAVKNKNDDAIKAADARYAELFNNAPDELKKMIRKINQHRIKLEFDKAADIEDRIYDSEYDDMYAKIDKADFERRLLRDKNKPRTATDLYRNTAGEIEARDVQRRRNMTAEERRNTFPESMKPNDNVVFADGGVSYSQDKSFAEQVSDVLSGKSSDNGNHVYVGETTSILRQLGLNDKPMLITAGHLKDINHDKVEGISKYHGLSEDTINKLPYILNYPAIVFDSFSEKNSDAVCILSEITDDDRLPILVIIKPDGQGKYNDVRIDSNFILSMYGKNNPKGFINNIGQNIDNVLFADKKRTQELLRVNGLQLPKSFSKLKFNTIIHKTRNVVKQSNENVKHSFSDEENPTSRFRTNTIERATMFTPDDLEAISPTEFEYIPESDKQWDEQAVKNVRTDMQGVMEKIRNAEAMTSGTMSHEAALISKALTDRYHASGSAADLAALTDWLKTVAEKTRGTARALKATDTAWEKSPAAAVSKAQSEVDSQWAEDDEKHPKKAKEIKQKKKDIDKGISDAGKAGFEQLIEEINRQQEKKQSQKKADGRSSHQRIRDKTFEKLNISESSGESGKKQAAFVDRVLGDLFGKLKKKKSTNGAKYSFDGWAHDIREAIQQRGEYAEAWNEMYELAREEYAGNAEAMAVIDEYFRTGRPPLVPLKTMDEAIGKAFENSGVKLGDVVRDYFINGEQTRQNLKDYIITQTGLSGEDADVLSEYVAKRYDELVEKKQIEYLEREFSKNERPKVIDSERVKQLGERIEKVFEGNEERKDMFYERVFGRVDMRIAQEIRAKNIDLIEIVKYGATATEKANYLHMKDLFSGLAGKVTRADIVQLQNVVYEEFARLSEVKNDKLLSKYFYNDTNGTTVVKNVRPKTEFGKILRLIEVAGRERADVIEEILRSEDGQPTLTENDVNAILNLMNSAEKIGDVSSYAYKAKIAEVKKIIESKKKPTAGAAIKAYARINMLLNPKTILTRNAGANLLQSGIYNAENALGTTIDKGISKVYGTQRTTAAPSMRTQMSGARQGLSEAIEDFRHGVDTRGFGGRYDIGEGSPFKGDGAISRALDKLNRTTGFLLDAGDRPFYEGYFRDVLRQQMEANNVAEPTEDMITIADMVALERTWQDENGFTDAFNGFKKALNRVSIPKANFGLGDVIMPFVKTPANLLKATIQYSPAGLAKTIAVDLNNFRNAYKDGSATPQMQKKLVDNLAKGIVGTLAMLAGTALTNAGLFTGEEDEDDKVNRFRQYVEGKMPNAIKVGDTSVSLDWLQPMGSTLTFGATLANEIKKDNSWGEKLKKSFSRSLETLVEASLLQGIREFFSTEYSSMGEKFAEAAKDAGTQMLPLGSLTKQTANLIDNTTRTTYSPSDADSYIRRISGYYPEVSKLAEPRLNAFGEEIQRSPDTANEKLTLASGAERLFNSFFNPANVRKIKTSDLIEELNRVYDMTGDSRVYPSEADKSITYDGTTYKLTSEQYTSYQRSIGKKTKDLLGELINSDKTATELVGKMSEDGAVYYADLSEDEQKSKLTSVKTRAANEYKESIGKKNVKIDDLSAAEERQLKKAQDEAVKRFKNGEPYKTQIEWSDVPYAQLDNMQKAEVIAKAITEAKKKAKEEVRADVEKNARPVFKVK